MESKRLKYKEMIFMQIQTGNKLKFSDAYSGWEFQAMRS